MSSVSAKQFGTGGLQLAFDDTQLLTCLRPYLDKEGPAKHYIVGSTASLVDSKPRGLFTIIAKVRVEKKASKVRCFTLQWHAEVCL